MADHLQIQKSAQLEKEVIEWADSVYDEAERDLADSREVRLTAKLIDYIGGQQWSAKARFGRSRPTVNRISRHFIEMAGLLTDIEPDFQVKFNSDDDDIGKLQDLLNEMVPMWARATDFESELTQAVMWALLHTGFAKVSWNNRMNSGMGDCDFLPLGPLHVMSIGAGNRLQEDACVIGRWPVTVESLYGCFPQEIVDQVNPDLENNDSGMDVLRPGKIAEGKWAMLPPQLKKLLGVKKIGNARRSRYPKVMLKQFWFRDRATNESNDTIEIGDQRFNWSYKVEPGMPLWPRGRFLIIAGGKVLQDNCNPYWHGMYPFAKLRLIRVPWSTNGQCYSSDTEVLTKRGWLKFSETNQLDEFATRQIGTGVFEWQQAIARTEEPYSGDMYAFHSRSMDILVTPEHRMLVDRLPRRLGHKFKLGESVVSAKNLAMFGTHHTRIPQTSVWYGTEIGEKDFSADKALITAKLVAKAKRVGRAGMTERHARIMAQYIGKTLRISGDDYCAFMGAFLSEGWTSKVSVFICQYADSKGYDPFEKLLTRILGRRPGRGKKDFALCRQTLRDHCCQFGSKAHLKFIPDEIMNATPRQQKIFWEYYMLGDGHSEPRKSNSGRGSHPGKPHERITTASKKMADQLVELAQKMGYSASCRERDAQENVQLFKGQGPSNIRKSWIVSLRHSTAMAVKSEVVYYEGMIHCVTVPNSFLYVRRNGKPAWCGNSPLEPLASMSDIINRINGGIMDMIRAAIEPKIVAPKAAFAQSVWDSMDPGAPGAKVMYNNNAPKPPEYPKPPELPSYVLTMKQDVEKEQDASSGASAISQALQKKQVPGGDSMDMILGSKSIPIRFMGRGLHSFLTEIGTMVVANKMQFETSASRVAKFGTKGLTDADFEPYYGQFLNKGMEPEKFVRQMTFEIRKGSLLAIEKQDEVQIGLVLRKMGDISRRALLRKMGLTTPQIEKIEGELLVEAQQKIALAGAAGAASHPHGGKK